MLEVSNFNIKNSTLKNRKYKTACLILEVAVCCLGHVKNKTD